MGKKARTVLTMLGIIISVVSVVIMASVVQGSNKKSMEYFERLGSNKNTVNLCGRRADAGKRLYKYCTRLPEFALGVTPNGHVSFLIVSSLRNTDNMENGTPDISLGNDKFSICNNFQIAKGRDLCVLDSEKFNHVVVLGARTAQHLFQLTNPVGQNVHIGGHPFTVVGVYKAKAPDSEYSMDNMAAVFPRPLLCSGLLRGVSPVSPCGSRCGSGSKALQIFQKVRQYISKSMSGWYLQNDGAANNVDLLFLPKESPHVFS